MSRGGGARLSLRALAALLLLALAGPGCTREDADVAHPLVMTSMLSTFSRSEPLSTERGKLRFRGGLQLKSTDADFGGLSGLLVSADGKRFIAASDESHWVTGNLEYDRNGNLAAASGGIIAPYLDMRGKPLAGKGGDAEGLASAGADDIDGDLFVSFEGKHRVWRYPFGRDGGSALPTELPVPAMVHQAPSNLGLEGITRVADGWLLAVSEHFQNDDGNYRAWLIPFQPSMPSPHDPPGGLLPRGTDTHAIEISLVPLHPFAMTDVRQLPGGDLLTLEKGASTRPTAWACR